MNNPTMMAFVLHLTVYTGCTDSKTWELCLFITSKPQRTLQMIPHIPVKQLVLGSRCRVRSHSNSVEARKCPGFCYIQAVQILPRDSALKSEQGQGSRCQLLSPLWLPLNHTCKEGFNPRAHKKILLKHISPSPPKCTRPH